MREGGRLRGACRGPIDEALTGDALIVAMMRRETHDHYNKSERHTGYVPLVSECMPEPEVGHSTDDMVAALPGFASSRYGNPEAILYEDVDANVQTVNCRSYDSGLGDRQEYVEYLKHHARREPLPP